MLVNLKSAVKSDLDYFFILRKFNTNNFSFIKNENFKYKNHVDWFLESLKNKRRLMYIVKFNNLRCGYARLDKERKNYFVSICIEKKFRKKGIGLRTLSLIERKIEKSNTITALVNKKNSNSIEMFSKFGYIISSKKKSYIIMKKKLNKIKIIDKIELIRKKNNGNWMDLLRIAYKYSPKESTLIMSKIYRDDNKISKLVKKLIK